LVFCISKSQKRGKHNSPHVFLWLSDDSAPLSSLFLHHFFLQDLFWEKGRKNQPLISHCPVDDVPSADTVRPPPAICALLLRTSILMRACVLLHQNVEDFFRLPTGSLKISPPTLQKATRKQRFGKRRRNFFCLGPFFCLLDLMKKQQSRQC
jgi:hypothetical protein